MKSQNSQFFPQGGTTEVSGFSDKAVFLKGFRQSGGAELKKSNPSRAASVARHSDIFVALAIQAPFVSDSRSEEAYLNMQKAVLGLSDSGPTQSV